MVAAPLSPQTFTFRAHKMKVVSPPHHPITAAAPRLRRRRTEAEFDVDMGSTVSCMWPGCDVEAPRRDMWAHLRDCHGKGQKTLTCEWAGCADALGQAVVLSRASFRHHVEAAHLDMKARCRWAGCGFRMRADMMSRHEGTCEKNPAKMGEQNVDPSASASRSRKRKTAARDEAQSGGDSMCVTYSFFWSFDSILIAMSRKKRRR